MFFQLFWTYLKIGTFTLGGGYAMLPLIQREVVDRKGWIDEDEYLNMIALAQAAPGLIAVNSAIFIGWRVGGWRGVCGAVLGAVLYRDDFSRLERDSCRGSRFQRYPACGSCPHCRPALQTGEVCDEGKRKTNKRERAECHFSIDFFSRSSADLARTH